MGNYITRSRCCRKRMWSCLCCCCSKSKSKKSSNHNETQAQGRSQNGSYLLKEPMEAKSTGKILVLNFSATWCLPFRRIALVYQELASTYTSMIFVTVDVEELAEFSNQWNVEATPTVVFLKDGRQILDKLVGSAADKLQKKTATVADLILRKP